MAGADYTLTTKTIAAELNVTEQTVRQYAREGLIPCTRTLKGHRRFDIDEVRAALRLARPRLLERLTAEELTARLSPAMGHRPIRRARRWQAQSIDAIIVEGDELEAERTSSGQVSLDVPFIDVPGSSRFIARAATGR
jgi:excisionase family DNA binding protein